MASRPVAVAFGATTVGAGIWMASNGQLGKRTQCVGMTAAGTGSPRSVVSNVSKNEVPAEMGG